MQNSEFHTRLKEARIAKSYSQSDLARIADVAPGQINRYEGGKNVPRAHILARLAGALGVEREWLQSGTGTRDTGTVTAYSKHLDVTTADKSGGGMDLFVDMDEKTHAVFSEEAAKAGMSLGDYLKQALMDRLDDIDRRIKQAETAGVDIDELARRVKALIDEDTGKTHRSQPR